MTIGYVKPGVQVTNKTEPSSVSLLASFRRTCIIGKGDTFIRVNNEAVIRSSTGNVDNLVYTSSGIVSLISAGNQVGLVNYVLDVDYTLTGNQIDWIGTNKPASNATYYVSYTYTRPASDYKYKEFTDFTPFTNDMGSPSASNEISLLTYIGVKVNLCPAWSTVQVKSPYSYNDFVNAIELTKYRDIQDVIVLSDDPDVQLYVSNFCKERSLPQNKKRRIQWTGSSTGTLPGDSVTAGTIAGEAATLKSKRSIIVSPSRGKVSFDDAVTKLTTTVQVSGSFIAGVLAMYRSTILDPAAPLLRKQIQGVEFYDEDFDTYFGDYNMDLMGTAGVCVLYPVLGIPTVRDDLTTDQSDVTTKDINIITASDYVDRVVEERLDSRFIGNKIIDQTQYTADVKNYIIRVLRLLQSEQVISSFSIGDIVCTIDRNAPTDILLSYSWVPIFTNKRIFGSYVLKTA